MLEREYVLPLPRATALMLQQFVDQVAVRRYRTTPTRCTSCRRGGDAARAAS